MPQATARNPRLLPALLLIALSICGFSATSAQAHEWLIGGQTLKEVEEKEEAEEGATFSSSQQGKFFNFEWPLSFHTFKWTCTKESGTGFLLPATPKFDASSTGRFEWSNCQFTEEFGACAIHTPVVASVRGELIEDEETGTLYEKYVPLSLGGPFFEFSWGFNECSVGGTWNFAGSFGAELEPTGTELLTQPQIFSPAIDSAVGAAIKPNETSPPLRISGALEFTLTGELAGRKWGAL